MNKVKSGISEWWDTNGGKVLVCSEVFVVAGLVGYLGYSVGYGNGYSEGAIAGAKAEYVSIRDFVSSIVTTAVKPA